MLYGLFLLMLRCNLSIRALRAFLVFLYMSLFFMVLLIPPLPFLVNNNLYFVLNVTIDLSGLQNLADLSEIERIGNKAAADLALLTQAKVQELAGERLHSRLEMFRKGLSLKQEDSGVWIVHLDDQVVWINDGMPARSMLPDLLNSPHAKTAVDGSRYMVVPFKMTAGKSGPTQVIPAQTDLVESVKKQLKEANIPWARIEKDASGMPLLGKLHSLKLSTPLKNAEPRPGHGRDSQGYGPVGYPRIGMTGTPFLAGASIFQSLNAQGKTERGVITFRVASSKQSSPLWDNPGVAPTRILEDAYEWAVREVDQHVMPEIMRQIELLGK